MKATPSSQNLTAGRQSFGRQSVNCPMKWILAVCFIGLLNFATAQSYQPTWESLESRPVPAWFKEGKFGIFIHWGVYAVPGWCPKGNYAEWYQYGLQSGDTARQRFHREKFGNLTYYDLADQFKA